MDVVNSREKREWRVPEGKRKWVLRKDIYTKYYTHLLVLLLSPFRWLFDSTRRVHPPLPDEGATQSSCLLSKLWTSHNRWGSKSSAADIVLTHKSLKQPWVLWAFLWREHLRSLLFFLVGFQLSWLLSHKIWKSEWHTKVNETKSFLSTVSSLVWSTTSPLKKKKISGFLKEQAKNLNDGKKICHRHPLIYFSSKIQD